MSKQAYEKVRQLAKGAGFSCQSVDEESTIQVTSFYPSFGIPDGRRLSEACQAHGVKLLSRSVKVFVVKGPVDSVCNAIKAAQE